MIIFEEQSKNWQEEFFECWKLQELYGDEIPLDLWDKLFSHAVRQSNY